MSWGLSEMKLTGKGKTVKSKWVEKFENRLREEDIIWEKIGHIKSKEEI